MHARTHTEAHSEGNLLSKYFEEANCFALGSETGKSAVQDCVVFSPDLSHPAPDRNFPGYQFPVLHLLFSDVAEQKGRRQFIFLMIAYHHTLPIAQLLRCMTTS